MRNKVFKTAPPTYKHVIVTLLLMRQVIPSPKSSNKVQQLGDLGEWNFEKRKIKKEQDKQTGYLERTRSWPLLQMGSQEKRLME